MQQASSVAASLQSVPGAPRVPAFTSQPGKSPFAYVTLATLAFLQGGEKLMGAAGHATEAAKCKTLREKIESEGPNRENLGEVNEIAAKMREVADRQGDLARADATMVTQAAVNIGVATWFETLAVKAAKDSVSSGGMANAREMILVSTMAPANLTSMMSVQKALFDYLQVKGIDPTADIQREISQLEKA
jgi:hypothetical protein